MKPLPAKLLPEQLTCVIDSREQMPLDVSPLRTVRSTLATGDYSILGLEHVVCIERKSEGDLLSCVGKDRKRFDACVQRMLSFPTRVLIVESSWQRCEAAEWRSQLTPQQVLGSLLGWVCRGVCVVMAGDHERAGKYTARILYTVARREYRVARQLAMGVAPVKEEVAS